MNLWAKTLRQLTLFSVALFFFSCTNEDSILGFRNPNKKFNVYQIEIPLSTSVVLIDSVITDNISSNTSQTHDVLVGQYDDPAFGMVKAESFLQLSPGSSTQLSASAIYDSVTIQLQLNFYAYGNSGQQQEKFTVHEITGDSLSYFKRYYYNNTLAYNTSPLGEVSMTVHYDSLRKEATRTTRKDTVARGRLDDNLGTRLFDLAKNNPDSKYSDFEKFRYEIKGIALVPSESKGVLGYNLNSTRSKITLHYHTDTDTLTAFFYFFPTRVGETSYNPSFTHITTERTGELSGAALYQTLETQSGLRYIQSGTPVITKIDLTNFYAFADTIQNIIVNESQLVISGIEAPLGVSPHSALLLRAINEDNVFANLRVQSDRDALLRYYLTQDGYFDVYADFRSSTQSVATLNYSGDTNQFGGYLTLFTQNLYVNRNVNHALNDTRLKYLALYPYSPSMSRSVTRTVFNKHNVKLRIKYTRPTQITP